MSSSPRSSSSSSCCCEACAAARGTRLLAWQDGTADVAAAVLRAGGLVALPSETVYGLAADARSDAAVAALFAAKGRPANNPLIVHVGSAAEAAAIGDLSAVPARLTARWPGPLTLVVPLADGTIARAALAGGTTVALRVPAHAAFRATLAAFGGPLVAPSANRSGRISATSAAAVMDELAGLIDLVVDGGPCPVGLESTVVDCTGTPRILRPGALGAAALGIAAGVAPAAEPGAPLRSPGLLGSHYAPRARLRLDVAAADVRADEGFLALGGEASAAAHTVRLSPAGDLSEAARNLYAALRALDAAGVAVIAVSPIPAEGIGVAIRDRLARAAAPRD